MPVGTGGSVVKNLPANAGDAGVIPGSGIYPGGENGNPFQYSCLENPTEGGAWWTAIHGVAKSGIRLRMSKTHLFVCAGFFVHPFPLFYSDISKGRMFCKFYVLQC